MQSLPLRLCLAFVFFGTICHRVQAQVYRDFDLERLAKQTQADEEDLKKRYDEKLEEIKPYQEKNPKKALGILGKFVDKLILDDNISSRARLTITSDASAKMKELKSLDFLVNSEKHLDNVQIYKDYLERAAQAERQSRAYSRCYLVLGGQPATFHFSNGYQTTGTLHNVKTTIIICTVGEKTYRYPSWQVPRIIVGGGAYLYTQYYASHVFLDNNQLAQLTASQQYYATPQYYTTSTNYVGNSATGRAVSRGTSPVLRAAGYGLGALVANWVAGWADRRSGFGYEVTSALARTARDELVRAGVREIVSGLTSDSEQAALFTDVVQRGISLAFDRELTPGNLAAATVREESTKWLVERLSQEYPDIPVATLHRLAEFAFVQLPRERERRIKSGIQNP